MSNICPFPMHLLSDNITALDAARLYSYKAGTVVEKPTYADADCTVQNANPYIFNSAGRAVTAGNEVNVWLKSDEAYDLIFKDENGNTIASISDYSVLGSGYGQIVGIVDTIADLRALNPGTWGGVIVKGYYAANDGGGGTFYWSSASTDTDDGGLTIVPNTLPASGRWKRILGKQISIVEFGAQDNGADMSEKIINAVAAANARNLPLVIPYGNDAYTVGYKVEADVNFYNVPIHLNGDLTIASTYTCSDMRLVAIGNGAKLAGSGTVTGVNIECSPITKVFDSTLSVSSYNKVIDVRWFDDNIDRAYLALPPNGGTIFLPVSTTPYNTPTLTYDVSYLAKSLKIQGQKQPDINSDATELEYGSIIKGPLRINKKYVEICDVGIDSGATRYPATAEDGLWVEYSPGIKIRNVTCLSKTVSTAGSCCILDDATGAEVSNLLMGAGYVGLEIKSPNVVAGNIKYQASASNLAAVRIIASSTRFPCSIALNNIDAYGATAVHIDNTNGTQDIIGVSITGVTVQDATNAIIIAGHSSSGFISDVSVVGLSRYNTTNRYAASGNYDNVFIDGAIEVVGTTNIINNLSATDFTAQNLAGSVAYIRENIEYDHDSPYIGTANLSNGEVTVAGIFPITACVFVSRRTEHGTPGHLSGVIDSSTDILIQSSSNDDNSEVNYIVIPIRP